MGMISPEILQQLYGKWQERLNQNDGELLKKSFVLMRKLCDQTNAKRKKLARSTNYWIMQADNVELFAPSLIGICTWLDEHPEIDINPIELEAAQCIVFAEERREELEQKNLVVVNVSNSNSKKLGFYRCNGRKKKDVRKMGEQIFN